MDRNFVILFTFITLNIGFSLRHSIVIGHQTDLLSPIGQFTTNNLILCPTHPHSNLPVIPTLANCPPTLLLCRTTHYIYKPRERRSMPAVIVALLLLLAGIESNPGPAASATQQLQLGSFNVRSAINKSASIHTLIADESLDVLALCETWAALDDPPAILQDIAPQGYNIIHAPRVTSRVGHRGGGLAVITSNSLTSRIITTSILITTFEAQCIHISTKQNNWILINIYRPPTSPPSPTFYDELTNYITEVIISKSLPIVLCGDLNCPGPQSYNISPQLHSTLDSLNFTQHINQPTRGHNLLDIIATDHNSLISSASVINTHHISDHSLVKCAININRPSAPIIEGKWRPMHRVDFSQLDNALYSSSLVSDPASTVDGYVQQIHTIVNEELDKVAPLRVSKHVQRPLPCDTFLSSDAISAKRERRRLERIWKRTGSETVRQQYRAACRVTTKTINDSRSHFLSEKLRSASLCAKSKWRQYKSLLHTSNAHSSACPGLGNTAQSFCNKLATFFQTKINNLRSSNALILQNQSPNPFSHDQPYIGTPLDSFTPVTPAEVLKLLSSLSLKFSPLDPFPSSLLKQCPRSFSSIISNLANLSFSQGFFPTQYKMAQVTPLLKKPNLNSDDVSNYRPISNLHTLSKILERLVLSRLQPAILSSNNFNPFQSAYRKQHSTETSLAKTFSDIYKSVDNGSSTLLVALDLSAAFDTIPHDILLQRLQHSFGITGVALNWLKSYLLSRSQYISLSGYRSPTLPLLFGVPQGSVLGPLLFTTFISPISPLVASFHLQHQQFADDTQIYVTLDKANPFLTVTRMESCLSSLCSWFAQNGLCINPSKSESIIFSTAKGLQRLKSLGLTSIFVSGSNIPISDKITTLGITADSSLSFSHHTQYLVKSCNFHIRALRHIRHLLTEQDTTALAVSLVQSKLDYCNSLFHNTSKSNLHSLQRIQNTLARIVLQPKTLTPSSTLLRSLHWLPVHHRVKHKVASLTHTAIHCKQPLYLHDTLQMHKPTRSLRSSNQFLLTTPRTHLHLTDQSFHVAAPSVFNALPLNIRLQSNLAQFKSSLKTHLFDAAFTSP